MSSPARPAPEQVGENEFASGVAEALKESPASAKLRQVVTADRKAFGPVSAEALREAEREW
ncbi:hypothetical protein [Streptomyces jumonjinensis]|uniref:hypothetical protein n=1 Tax=Streptomyces jumonjinensis TaxID=1945 RepID=UPI00378E6FFE